jgi:hypothetical protein
VTTIATDVFISCDTLTSVTFAAGSRIPSANFGINAFPEGGGPGAQRGNILRTVYLADGGGAGTYTRSAGGTDWAKR